MMKLFEQDFYKKAVRDYQDAKNEIDNMIAKNVYKDSVIAERKQALIEPIRASVNKGYETLRNTIERDNQAIVERYSTKYSNVNDEILKRQDFDMKVELMNASDLKEFIQDNASSFDVYQLNKLKIYVKTLNPIEQGDLMQTLVRCETQYSIGKKWLLDEEYQKNLLLKAELNQTNKSYLFSADANGNYQINDLDTF